jgi:hypothetical protein
MSGSVTAEADYLALFSHCAPDKVIGEASPSYLVDPDTPALIRQRVPDARILVMVRDPVDRAFSHYLFHEVRTGRTDRTFSQAIDDCLEHIDEAFYHPRFLLQPGFYASQIIRYRDVFGAEAVHVVVYDDFVAETDAELTRVCDFLGVRPPNDTALSSSQRNAAGAPRNEAARFIMKNPLLRSGLSRLGLGAKAVELGKRWLLRPAEKPPMDPLDLERLREIYAEDVAALEQLLDRPLPWQPSRRI